MDLNFDANLIHFNDSNKEIIKIFVNILNYIVHTAFDRILFPFFESSKFVGLFLDIMIQRKQSLFLLGSVIISVLLLYLPVFELLSDIAGNPGKEYTITINALLSIINGAIGVLSFVAIFLYRNRNIQVRLCNLALLLTCVLIGLLFFFGDTMSTGLNQKIHYTYGSYLPLIQVVFIFLASIFIRRDEKLVRSADRLR